jgi:hypothetical protein
MLLAVLFMIDATGKKTHKIPQKQLSAISGQLSAKNLIF